MNIKPIIIEQIGKNQFNLFMLFTRNPLLPMFAKELEYYSNEENTLLGVILFDNTDHDYNYVLMARDENRQFRAFDVKTNYRTQEEAVARLTDAMKWNTGQGIKVIEQNLPKNGLELFKIVILQENIHPYFTRLDNDSQYTASKKAVIEVANHLSDIDGNFIEQFQSKNGFDARLWEIYLFAALAEQGFIINRKYDRPDFIVEKGDVLIGIEATTLGRDKENPATYFFKEVDMSNFYQINTKLKNETPLRFGSALFSKLNKKYWNLPHLQDKPLLIAIADFHDNMSMTWSHIALIEYLYGHRQVLEISPDGSHNISTEKIANYVKATGTEIEPGFFFQKDTENISGVIFSTTGTISKFTRIGIQAGFGLKNQYVLRVGDRYDFSANSFKAIPFSYVVDENCNEMWSEGMNLFHNPFAKHKLDIELFPYIAHHTFEDGQLITWAPQFHPFSSININTVFV